jgi:RNA polymerase sigma factor (sigma-70 family)
LTSVEFEFYRRQARFVARQVAPEHLVEDMTAEGIASLVKSLRTYDPKSMASLGSYVLQRMKWAMLDAMRVWRGGSRGDSARGVFYADVPLDEARDATTIPAVSTDRIDLARAVSTLPPQRRRFMEAWLRLDDIAQASAEVGMSTNCGAQHYFQAVRALRKALELN